MEHRYARFSMAIERRGDAFVITHALARHTLSELRDVETDQVAFREGLVELGRLCGSEIVDGRMETEFVAVQTPLAETTGERVRGIDDVVIVTVLRAATPFVQGLLDAFPRARQGVISASRDEAAGQDDEGRFPISVDYVKLPEVGPEDTVIVADPMLATGSTLSAVLDRVTAVAHEDATVLALTAVAAPPGVKRLGEEWPDVDLLTVAIDERLDEEGFIVPGLGDAGDRAFRTD